MLSCDVIISDDNILLFYFSWKLHALLSRCDLTQKDLSFFKRPRAALGTKRFGTFRTKRNIAHLIFFHIGPGSQEVTKNWNDDAIIGKIYLSPKLT